MTYAQKYGKYGFYTNGLLYKWFKSLDNAMKYWNENVVNCPEATEEWTDEYDTVSIRNMKTGEVIVEI